MGHIKYQRLGRDVSGFAARRDARHLLRRSIKYRRCFSPGRRVKPALELNRPESSLSPDQALKQSCSQNYEIRDLLQIMADLRTEDGCPWDRKQNHHSLRQYLVEEAYEVVAAIDQGDDEALVEELGDVLLQVVFHSRIAEEEERFDFDRVVNGIAAKLIRRHPHVFGKGEAADASEVRVMWEQIKRNEKMNRGEERAGQPYQVDHALPALLRSYKLQKKAAAVGFDWPCVQGPLEKIEEELAELIEARESGNRAAVEEELGDFIFSVVNVARFLKVNPEVALGKANNKFSERFSYVMQQAEKRGRSTADYSLEILDKWWEEAKKIKKISK